jgi:tRNA(fMet)-specific endonuclease VapC
MTYALDTNIIIHLLHNNSAVIAKRNEALEQGIQIVIPPYVNFEMLRGFRYVSAPSKEQSYKLLRANCLVGEMSINAWELAATLYANLRHAKRTVGDADILIAAFCVVNDHTLVTNNTKDFENIDGLHLVNWVE